MSYPSTGGMRWREPGGPSSPRVIPRSLPGQDDGGPSSGPISRPSAGYEVPDPNRGPITAGLLTFTVVIAIALVVVNLVDLHLPGRAVLAVATLVFGPGIPGAMLLKLPSMLVEFVLGVALSLSAVMLLSTALVEAHAFSAMSMMVLLNGATVLLAIPAGLALTSPDQGGRR